MTTVARQESVARPSANRPRGVWDALRRRMAIAQQRRALRSLDDHMLKDIGVTAAEAIAEAEKPHWDVPTNWRA